MAPLGTPRASREGCSALPGVAEGAGDWLASQTPHPPAAHRGERLVPPHPAIPAERASRTQALDGLAAAAKSVAAHPPQSATSTKDCLERRNSIRPCVPSHLAYKAERGGNELFKSGTETARPRCICQHEVERA